MKWIVCVLFCAIIGLMPKTQVKTLGSDDLDNVQSLIEQFSGEASVNKLDSSIEGVSVEAGKELVHYGVTTKPNGGKTRRQSKHFVCTSCHNVEKEFADLTTIDPQARLDYAVENNLPFLQGSSFYGIVNRTRFYNGDYFKKYGELVVDAREDIRASIQLCATQCAQGRALDAWEIESILAYFWTLQLKMSDLNLNDTELEIVQTALKDKQQASEALDLLRSKYIDYSPATFLDPPKNRRAGHVDVVGNPNNGKHIYELSCLHCHEDSRYAFYELDASKMSLAHLKYNLFKYNNLSAYQVVRYGTEPLPGKRAYMPHYTKEKMSIQQMEDLRSYVLALGKIAMDK